MAPHLDSHFIHIAIRNRAVRTGKVNVFEDAKGAAVLIRKRVQAGNAFLVDDDDFAGLDIAHEFRLNEIEGASLAGKHPGLTQLAQAQWPEPMRISDSNQFLFGHDDQRVGSF